MSVVFFAAVTALTFPACVSPTPHAIASSVAYDVRSGPENVIDQQWEISVTVQRTEVVDVSFELLIPKWTSEDAIAAMVAHAINVYCEDVNLATLAEDPAGPDWVGLKEATIRSTAKPADGNGNGHVEVLAISLSGSRLVEPR